LARYDILVLTSDFEGTPIAMMEALAAGCGMVGTRVSGIEDYELHPQASDCFALFDTGNIEDAVSKIENIANVPVNTRQQSARKLAESEFSMQVCLEKYSKAIATIKPCEKNMVMTVKIPVWANIYSWIIAATRYMKMSMKKRPD
jgi:glycosyltransferase involved in cell wall biosynthesis